VIVLRWKSISVSEELFRKIIGVVAKMEADKRRRVSICEAVELALSKFEYVPEQKAIEKQSMCQSNRITFREIA
jgi:hypothetical protein